MSLRDDVNDLKKFIGEGKLEEKKFKYPFGKKVNKSERKKNFVTVLLLMENGTYDFKKYQIQEQTFVHDVIPRLATAGHVMHDSKGNPLVILPNWSVEPFSPLDNYEKSMINGSNTKGYKILMAAMIANKTDAKKPIAGWIKWAIGLLILGGIVFALVSGGDGGATAQVVTP